MARGRFKICSPRPRCPSHPVRFTNFCPVFLEELVYSNGFHIKDDISECIILEAIALNALENHIHELRGFVLNSMLSAK